MGGSRRVNRFVADGPWASAASVVQVVLGAADGIALVVQCCRQVHAWLARRAREKGDGAEHADPTEDIDEMA